MESYYKLSKSAITFNGKCLDEEIKGYMTLNVIGRQMFAPKLESQEIRGRDGDITTSLSYPARDIEVQYYLQAENNREWLQKMKKLTMLLQSKEDVEYSFADEYGVRFGRLSGFEDPPYDWNAGIGKFTIHSQDPFLYSELREDTNKIKELRYDYYPIKIVTISLIVGVAGNKFVLRNAETGNRIIVNDYFKAGDKIVFRDKKIFKNNKNMLANLDYVASDFFDFDLYSGHSLSCNLASQIKIEYREKVL